MQRRNLMAIMGGGVAASLVAQVHAEGPNDSIARSFAQTLSAHDIDAFSKLFADDYVNHQASAAVTAPVGVSAKKSSVAFFAARLVGLPDLEVSIEAITSDSDKVAASFVYEGTHKGLYMGVMPTGRRLRFTSCDIFRVRDKQIAEHWGMGDIAGVLAQLKA